MKGLVEDMLFLAKHDDARQSAKTQVCNLSDLVTGCVLRFESVAFESGVELDSEIQPRLSIHGDLDCLERLVRILLDNAVKYAGEAGRVRLELQRRQERAVLTVTNTGKPIPPEHLEHLFSGFTGLTVPAAGRRAGMAWDWLLPRPSFSSTGDRSK